MYINSRENLGVREPSSQNSGVRPNPRTHLSPMLSSDTHIYMYNVLFPKLKIVCLGLKKADMKKKKISIQNIHDLGATVKVVAVCGT